MDAAAAPAPSVENGGATLPVPAAAPAVAAVTKFPPDSLKREFDPEKFRLGDDGFPRLDSFKRFIPLKGGRNRADGSPAQPRNGQKLPEPPAADFADVEAAAGSAAALPADPNGSAPAGLVGDEYMQAAAASVSMISTAAILVMGAHVKPSSDQIAAMVSSYADCYRAYGYAPKTPPWLGPVIATGAWIGPHLRSKETQTNLQATKAKFVAFLGWFRGRRDARAAASVSTEVVQRAS